MKQVKRPEHRRIGFEEFPGEALCAVPADEKIEAVPPEQRRARGNAREKDHEESEHRHALVELHGMAPETVAEIDAPRQGRENTEGVVRQAGEEAAPAAYGDAQRQRRHQTNA